ncbi:glycoside hydrolase family 13 protein [Paecilomyces variotii]|uniref:alpha-amylase n=1 Tax=Byssochlamys spectabilis TaxID=264951 RepID=A0A443HRT5_BYSSP|nr:glycoside hydrolase family 13 protein [Paecilomyces variotii]KAJ9199017.1 CAZyme family GH13 [Paecilomyces variotii]KAJ9276044.1 CAZyme family GH13 [Paecilomyces variotii]KAJ9288353.1 CAZyme family GH13 [Paecilomyces variotii]KAJ9342240.1 CAZyme family GH13 [Paecilomyces variotii]KAJ9365503.1 CAZyme family GH13 [Paecilomyces variotii]
MALFKYISLFLVCVVELSRAASNDEWAQRSIYQVVVDRFARSSDFDAPCNITNYCGGNWAGLVDKLDYIQGMGFTAVQISPVNKNLNQTTIYGQAYHGYWPQNLYELNEHFGSESDFKNLVSELHKRDMYILVDVVANEMAYDIGNTTMSTSYPIDYSVFYPFNQESDYMPYCPITNWLNVTEVQDCWLGYEGVATPRINTLNSSINSQLNSWIKELVSNYSIDGIRIDGAKQINYDFLQPFLKSANVYGMAEVDDDIPSYVCNYQKWTGGLENYPLYFTIINAFTDGDMPGLVSMISQMRSACSETQYLATFIENQDNERFPSYVDDINLAKNAMAFTILADGIPKIYYGQEQHLPGNYSPYNRQELWSTNYNTSAPLYNLTATLNKLRNHAIKVNSNYVTNDSSLLYTDNSTYAARKGVNGVQIVSVLSNQGSNGGAYELQVPGAADEGTELTEVFGCSTVTAGKNGTITVNMDKGEPRVFFPTFNMNGSGLCGTEDTTTPTASGSSTGTSSSSSVSASSTKKNLAEHLRVPAWLLLGSIGVFSVLML